MHRYEYSGLEFGFNREDVMALPSNYMGLSRLEFFVRLESLKRYKAANVQLDITFTVLAPKSTQHQHVKSLISTVFVNVSEIHSSRYNVACASEALTLWFNSMCEIFPLPIKLGAKVEKLCDRDDLSCRRLLLRDVFGLALLHFCS